MTSKMQNQSGVQDLCRKLKEQLDSLAQTIHIEDPMTVEEQGRRRELMERLKKQLADLSL